MEENELNALETPGEHPPIATGEIDAPEVEPDGEHAPETDVVPDTAEIQAEKERLLKLKDQAKKAESEVGYWRRKEAEAREVYRNPPPMQVPATAEATQPEPQADDFDDYTDFVKAHSGWTADQRVAAAKADWDKKEADKVNLEQETKRQAELKVKFDEGYAKYDDFAEVAFDRTATHITPMIVDILADCDNPADVAYHLAKDRVNGVKISRMTPTMAAREIMKLDQSFGAGPIAPGKKTTSAPPPIKPIGSSNTVGKNPEQMTQSEYEEYRLKQGARKF